MISYLPCEALCRTQLKAKAAAFPRGRPKHDEVVRWQTVGCEGSRIGGFTHSTSVGWQEPALPPLAGPIPITEPLVETCQVRFAAKSKDTS